MENTSIKDTSNKTERTDKNNLITLKPHTVKNNTNYRKQRLCISFSPSLFNHRVNGASVAATVTTRGLLGNKCNNATLSPIRDCSITSSPGPVYFQCCRLPSMGATMAWKQSKCLLAVLSVSHKTTKLRDSETIKAYDICIHSVNPTKNLSLCTIYYASMLEFTASRHT